MRIVLLILLMVSFPVAATVYKYINEKGEVSFSDVPIDGAKEISIPPVMTYTPSEKEKNAAKAFTEPTQKVVDDAFEGYQVLMITNPKNEGTVRDNLGRVNIAYELRPSLVQGHHAELFLNGAQQNTFSLSGLNRGEYTAYVQIVDTAGELLIQSEAITFYLHRQIAQ